jgi:hypothetical protein
MCRYPAGSDYQGYDKGGYSYFWPEEYDHGGQGSAEQSMLGRETVIGSMADQRLDMVRYEWPGVVIKLGSDFIQNSRNYNCCKGRPGNHFFMLPAGLPPGRKPYQNYGYKQIFSTKSY